MLPGDPWCAPVVPDGPRWSQGKHDAWRGGEALRLVRRILFNFPGKRGGAGFSFSWRPKALAEPSDRTGVGGSGSRSKPDENDTFWYRRPKSTEKMS